MSWSNTLAASAQSWANSQISSGACAGRLSHSGAPGVGENIAFMASSWTITDAVNMWTAEQACYNYATNTCAATCSFTYRGVRVSPNTCGHYTQVVWRDSAEVGCAVANCPGGAYSVWVCQYTPRGNIRGRTPY